MVVEDWQNRDGTDLAVQIWSDCPEWARLSDRTKDL